LTGTGVGHGLWLALGPHAALTVGACATRNAAEAAAARIRTAGARRRVPGDRMKRGNGTRVGFVTPAATESTRLSSARESASLARAPLGAGASGPSALRR